MKKNTLLLLPLLLINFFSFGEGTAQLMPNPAIPTSIQIWPSNNPNRDSFTYGAPENKRLYFSIGSIGGATAETVYFGFGNIINGVPDNFNASNWNNGSPNRLHFRIYRPDGTLFGTYNNVLVPTNGAVGHIASYARAVAGPAQLVGASGYNALHLEPDQTGEWWIEFNIGNNASVQPVDKAIIRLIDITVSAGKGAFGSNTGVYVPAGTVNSGGAILGRLFSPSWEIQCYSATNPFLASMFPYTPGGITLVVDFNGIQPYGFQVSMNSLGLSDDPAVAVNIRRRSTEGQFTFPDYPIFLNDPDETLYPSGVVADVDIEIQEAIDCTVGEGYDILAEVNTAGFVEAYLDLDNTGFFEPNGQDVIITPVNAQPNGFFDPVVAGTNAARLRWDGLDGLGAIVPDGTTISFVAYIQIGLTHLPLYDVENHNNGFIVDLVRPTTDIGGNVIPPPNLFWDDTQLNDNSNYPATPGTTSAEFDLTGCTPPGGGVGCHTWVDEDVATHNTWFYIRRVDVPGTFVIDNPDFIIVDNRPSALCETPIVNKPFEDITFTVEFNPDEYSDPLTDLSFAVNDNLGGATYSLSQQGTPTLGAPFTVNAGSETFNRNTIEVTYRVTPTPEATEVDFDFTVSGNPELAPDPPPAGPRLQGCENPKTVSMRVDCDNVLLPITLLDLSAKNVGQQATLISWSTVNELDNKGFYVQQSIDGANFKDLSFVDGKGTTNSLSEYEFLDNEYWVGTAYYRLRQVDFDDTETLTKVVSVERNEFNDAFALYPNPNQPGGDLFLRGWAGKEAISLLSIVNMTGQLVSQDVEIEDTPKGVRIPLPQNLSKGVYILKVVTTFGAENFKFVVE